MVIQVYVDESGGKGQGPVFVFSALIGMAEDWAKFSDDWKSRLEQSPRIRYFKMNEAANLSGEFDRMSRTARDEKLRQLCRIIGGASLRELFCVVKLSEFKKTIAEHSGRPMSEPYFYPFHIIIMAVGYEMLELDINQPFEIFFDENVIFGPRAKAWYPVIRSMLDDDVRAVVPVEPFFRSDHDALPLQAADMTAWIRRRWNADGNKQFLWMESELRGLAPAFHSQLLDGVRMKEIVDQSYTPEMLAKLKPILRAYRETFGHDWPPKNKKQLKRQRRR